MASSEQPLDRFRLPAAREQTSQNAHPPPFLPLAILPPQSQSSPIPAPSPLTGNTHGTSSLPPALAPAEHPLPLFSRRAPLAPPVIRLRAGGVAPKRNSAWRAEKTACLLFFFFFGSVQCWAFPTVSGARDPAPPTWPVRRVVPNPDCR